MAKTGLGSSAALTTSLVGGLLEWFGVVKLVDGTDSENRRIIHNLSQLVHANAQGKIGSGFDVAAAVYGEFGSFLDSLFSIQYYRYSNIPTIFNDCVLSVP